MQEQGKFIMRINQSVYSLISDVCPTVYDFLTRVNSSRTRCYLLNSTWLQVWPVTTTCRRFLRAEFFLLTSPFLFPAAAGVKKTSCGQSCFYDHRDCLVRIVLRLLTPFCFADHKLEHVGPLLVDHLDMRSLWYCSFNRTKIFTSAFKFRAKYSHINL